MGSPFGSDPPSRRFGDTSPQSPASGAAGPIGGDPPDEPQAPPAADTASPAQQKFVSCRWRKAAENGLPDHCGHRDVLPMAGATGFVPESWCPDCEYFKAKRTPRKREEIDRDRDWRW